MKGFIYRTFNESRHAILNAEEMASLFHLPLPETETPNINWLSARTLPAPVNIPTEGILLGENIYRGARTKISMKEDDHVRHWNDGDRKIRADGEYGNPGYSKRERGCRD